MKQLGHNSCTPFLLLGHNSCTRNLARTQLITKQQIGFRTEEKIIEDVGFDG